MSKSLGKFWIAQNALDTMVQESDRAFPLETGGTLIAYWVTEIELVVTCATTPGRHARRRATEYWPDYVHDEAEIARHYLASGRHHTYLGDWHTHPNGPTHLSSTDRETLVRIGSHGPARTPNAIMLIVGGEPEGWRMGVWCLRSSKKMFAFQIQPF